MRRTGALSLLGLVAAGGALPVSAQLPRGDSIPARYSLLSEHGPMRVLRFLAAPGERSEMHTHAPHFAYVVRGGQVRFSYPDGQVRDVPLQAGQRFEIPRRLTHAVEVTGGDTVIVLLVEYRLDSARAPAPPAAPATPLDWSADDSARIAWLAQRGRRVAGRHAVVWAPRDSLSDAHHRALVDTLDRGIAEMQRLLGERSWQRTRGQPVTYYLSPGSFVSHGSTFGAVFIRVGLAQQGRAPYLHEAAHVLLLGPPPSYPSEYADSTEQERRAMTWPLWLTEGFPDVLAQRAAAATGAREGDVFSIGGLAKADSTCAARVAESPFGPGVLAVVGGRGRLPELFTTDRPKVAPTFYACSQSAAHFLAERIGIERVGALFPMLPSETWAEGIERATGLTLAQFQAAWRRALPAARDSGR